MSENKVVSLQLTQKMLQEAPSAAHVISLPAVRQSWIEKYNLANGNGNGEMAFEMEKFIFAQTIAESDKLQKVDRFTLHAAWTMHAISGLTFRDNEAYILPYKGKAVWQPGWKGRLKQIQQWPTVISTTEPTIVYNCDEFDFVTDMDGKKLTKPHRSVFPRPANAEMIYVFMIIRYTTHSELYVMDRDEVNMIRDNYSEAYKYYMSKGGKWPDGGAMEKPLALSNPAQYWRKTLVKRIYNNNNNAKTAAQKVLDAHFTKADMFNDDADDRVLLTEKTSTVETQQQLENALDINTMPTGEENQSAKTEEVYTELPEEIKEAIAGAQSKKDLAAIKDSCSKFEGYKFFTDALNSRLEEIKANKTPETPAKPAEDTEQTDTVDVAHTDVTNKEQSDVAVTLAQDNADQNTQAPPATTAANDDDLDF